MADLNNSSWSETDASNTAAVPNGWPAGMFPNQVEPTAQAMMGALKRWWNRVNGIYVASGAAGIYAVTPSNIAFPTAYVDGERYTWKAHQPSQGGDTLNWNGLGAKPLFKPGTGGFVAIGANDIVSGQRVDVVYDVTLNGSAGGFALMGPPTASIAAPVGSVVAYAGSAAPSGWLLCTGQAVSRTSFAALYAALGGAGSPYGQGDGSTTFNVPDLRGRVIAGVDAGGVRLGGGPAGGITGAASLAAVGGEQAHVLTIAELAAHSHAVSDPSHNHGLAGGFTGLVGLGGPAGSQLQGGTPVGATVDATGLLNSGTGITIGNSGSNNTHNNLQPTLILNYIIKT
jgi:microcystin-dependent protein